MSPRRHGPSTTAIHGVPRRRPDWTPVAPAIEQSSTFVAPVGSDEDILYSRYGNNPTQVALAKKYALLEGAEDAIFLASGMGATALAHLAVLRPGDHLVSSSWIYGGTQHLFDEELSRFGIDVTYVRPDQPRLWRKSVRKATRAIFVETPTNPLMRVVDLAPVAHVAREYGLALLVDATFASPINFRPLEHGADVVITSATKYLNGHSDVIAGVVARLGRVCRGGQPADAALGPGDRPACGLAGRPRACGRSRSGWHATTPTAPRSPSGRRSRPPSPRSTTPASPTIRTTSSRPKCSTASAAWWVSSWPAGSRPRDRLLTRVKLVTHAPSLAGVESLVSEPRLTSHKGLSAEERTALGIPDGFLRLSCGLEDAEDIIADLSDALGKS